MLPDIARKILDLMNITIRERGVFRKGARFEIGAGAH